VDGETEKAVDSIIERLLAVRSPPIVVLCDSGVPDTGGCGAASWRPVLGCSPRWRMPRKGSMWCANFRRESASQLASMRARQGVGGLTSGACGRNPGDSRRKREIRWSINPLTLADVAPLLRLCVHVLRKLFRG